MAKLIPEILATLPHIEEGFVKDILKRLESFGYKPQKADSWILAFQIRKTYEDICSQCHKFPPEFQSHGVDRVCGEFLLFLKQSGKLDLSLFSVDTAVKTVQAGDTSVTFDLANSAEAQLEALIVHLATSGKGELNCYRKMKW